MSLTRFQPEKTRATPDMLDLQRRLGGTLGVLSMGGDEVSVLRLGENVYASSERPKAPIQAGLELDQADLHVVRSNSDLVYFAMRYKEFEKEEKDGQAR